MRRLLTSFTLIPALMTPVVLASPAAAATIPVTNANCTAFSSAGSISGAPGDLVDITANMTGCRSVEVLKSIVSAQSDVVVTSASSVTINDGGSYWTFDSGFGNTISRVQITLGSTIGTFSSAISIRENAGPRAKQWNVTISAGGGGGGGSSSSSPASAPGPTPILQQFGRPATGTCNASQPAGLNWAGVASGGWIESWAQWVNGGQGGAVCTRSLIYSTSQSKWILGES